MYHPLLGCLQTSCEFLWCAVLCVGDLELGEPTFFKGGNGQEATSYKVTKESDFTGPFTGSLIPEFHFTFRTDASQFPGLQTHSA